MAGIDGVGSGGGGNDFMHVIAPIAETMAPLFSGVGNLVGKADPLSGIIDGIASAIGIPQELKNAVKVGVGLLVGDPVLAVSGGISLYGNLVGDLGHMMANQPAQTEYKPPAGPTGETCHVDGYAAPRPPTHEASSPGVQTFPPLDIRPDADVPDGGPARPSQYLDPNLAGYRDALGVLKENFATFDTAVGKKDGRFSRANLESIQHNPNASPTLKNAAQFLLGHPEFFNRLEMATSSRPDGIASKKDVEAELGQVNAQLRASSRPPPGASSSIDDHPLTPCEGHVRGVLNDPGMSRDDKVMAILSGIMGSLDEQIDSTVEQLAAANGKDAKAGGPSAQSLQLKLQQLTEKRSQMFQLMTNFSEKQNEMAKAAIANMGRA